MQESQETHISNHLDEIVAAVSITPGKKIQNKLPQTALFQPPREKLCLCEEKAKSYSSSQEYKQAVHELVRCVALTRICYGDSHWKLAEAHVNLAQGYLQLKGMSLQAKQHAEKAKEILTNSIVPPYHDDTDVFKCSVELFHTMGRALLSLHKFKEASENLTKAERLAKELLQCERIIKEEWIEIQARIKLSLAQLYQGQKKSKEALPHYQEALEYIETSKGEQSLECVPILRELAGVEQTLGFHNASIDHFLQAHLIVLSRNPSQEEAAVSGHFVAHAAVASGRPEHHAVAEQYFQESMANLKDAEGVGKAKFLSIQDEYCHFLQVTGQQERATSILRESLQAKVGVFGDLSPEVAETYRLLGGADLAQGNHSGAHRKLKKLSWRKMMVACSKTVARGWSKVVGELRDVDKDIEPTALGNSECLQIQTLLYGPQDKRTLATQKTLDVLSKAPEMAVKPRPAPRAKPAFCTGVPPHTVLGKARSNAAD
ncbi:tetratricopeptide repeat protein 23 isoform X1 [Diceros bicornis minor]|uniref:tetratricopeptide repeat protein 23 isoform X1 n=1 Tax=Diceros bicornis minor TaxID=77932 RepID=UPI0026E94973|nr:tetratricopeptide repeat protein 23 isoform X1 [Diceros bicornis minor]XP_058398337.1 tetratricopeptide repeat protein 23 isoform X1 [Diceros bicornis minor]XP_058398338.1 tetratricopeptide repeat protein 23 isoform X1 [Diceros bicornis minor]XP_058398339.1 tetratricopeptide repeat protein 23 isoform X1 [Diceros bicornis minor]XP_058398342.1 tetratricopeptide repeat protein 23 isoform X1 [Diceros bicornis minor]XP_058398344.1 tetratricopeptide repeat protein 23 isoform X1 [Diceros bicornis 